MTRAVEAAPAPGPDSVAPTPEAEIDDDPDRLRPDELPWGVPARALVGVGGQLPPPTLVSRRRPGSGSARLVAVVAISVAIVVLLIVALTR